MKAKLKHLSLLFKFSPLLLILSSCGPSVVEPVKKSTDTIAEKMVMVNQHMVQQDRELIKSYATRHKWSVTETDNGLFYCITKKVSKNKVQKGKTVSIDYRVELLDGTYCYSSDSTGVKEFKTGARQVETGLDEGILLLGEGDEAYFIIPPHLGNGFSGDGNRIPARSVIVYWVKLLKISDTSDN